MQQNKKIGFILFENYWQRKNIGGSRIRGKWVIEKMQELGADAEEFVQGKKYDVVVFQKVYWKEFAMAFEGIKILDICDPDWLDGAEVISFCQYVDAITVPTEELKAELETMTGKPVYLIPDRENLEILPEPKIHKGIARKVVWFGYSHNLPALEPALDKLSKMDLTLLVISEGEFHTSICKVENKKWSIETEALDIQDADFALLPELKTGRWKYKSQNKTIHSWALGLPVAKTEKELELFLDEEARKKESEKRLLEVREKYDVRLSAKEMLKVIEEIGNEKKL